MTPDDISGLRAKLALNRRDLAHGLGISPATIERWESGAAPLRGAHLDVLGGISRAIEAGADPEAVGRELALGLGAMIFHRLIALNRD